MPVTNYLWDPVDDVLLKEYDDQGNTIVSYTHEPGYHGKLISQRRDGQTSYYHYDGEGNTRALTDENGDVTDRYTYNASGEVLSHSGSTTNPFGYKGALGYYANPETNDYYVRARTYEPTIARWLSADPAGFVDGMNLYLYVGNDPVNKIDPSGMLCIAKSSPAPYYYGNGTMVWGAVYALRPNERKGFVIQKISLSYFAKDCEGNTLLVSPPCQVTATTIPPSEFSEEQQAKYPEKWYHYKSPFAPKEMRWLTFWELFPINADQRVITNKGVPAGQKQWFVDTWRTNVLEKKASGFVSFGGSAYFSRGQKASGSGLPNMPDPPGGWGRWKSGAGLIPGKIWYSCQKPADNADKPAVSRSVMYFWNDCCEPALSPKTGGYARSREGLVATIDPLHWKVTGYCNNWRLGE